LDNQVVNKEEKDEESDDEEEDEKKESNEAIESAIPLEVDDKKLDNIVDESLMDILSNVSNESEVKKEIKEVNKPKVPMKKLSGNKRLMDNVISKKIPLKIGPSIPPQLMKLHQSKHDVITTEQYVPTPQEQSNEYQTQTQINSQWNPDFTREFEKLNPGFKVEELSMNLTPNEMIEVNGHDLRMKNWEVYDQMNKDKENYNKTIRARSTPISKGARRQGHVSYLVQQASQNEHELFDLWTKGKTQRSKTRSKYGW